MNRYLFIILTIVLVVSSTPLFSDGNRGVKTYMEGLDPNLKVGKQYLVVIGINEYQQWMPLHSPVKDVKEIKDIIVSRYYIDEVYELYDAEATKANIIKLFVKLQEEVGIDDSLLILYAGHGHLDKNSNTGFWIPVNAGTDVYEQHNWLPHTQLKGLIANTEASHIFVISDSCFAGDLIHTTRSIPPTINDEYFKRAYSRVSRQVLTSGATETVPDDSDFAYQLKSILKRNENRFLDTLMLYNEIRLGVETSIPLLGALEGTGHQEGASFLLFLREEAQTDQTIFGPIHLEPGPSLAAVGETEEGYLTAGIRVGYVFPIADMAQVMDGGIDLLSQLHYNLRYDWGDIGIGLSTGAMRLSTDPSVQINYNMLCVPVALNLKYMTGSKSPFYWSVDMSSGAMINVVRFEGQDTNDITTSKIFFRPTVCIGRQFFNRWGLSVFGSYLLILFDTNFFTGISTGVRWEYSF